MKVNELLRINQDLTLLLKEKLALKIKFRVQNYLDKIKDTVANTYKERDNIVKELEPKTMYIPTHLEDKSINPKFTQFTERFNEILEETIDAPPVLELSAEDIENIETENHYDALMKWLGW